MEYKTYLYHPISLEQTQDNETKDETIFFLSLSNSWSRKTINRIFQGEAKLFDILKEKSKFFLPLENGLVFTEDSLEENFEYIDIFLEEWLNIKIIEHIDFLLKHRLNNKES